MAGRARRRRHAGWRGSAAAAGRAACTLDGPAAGLYLLLWNRSTPAAAGVSVSGDAELAAAWRAGIHVRW